MKVYTKIEEFLSAAKPQTAPSTPTTKPGTAPTTRPNPSRPSPIRRDKPSVEPQPKAKANEVVDRFMRELKKSKSPIHFDISKLKERYEG
jgi:hypothetical protein